MSRIFVHGVGAVSPAGWGVGVLRDAVIGPRPRPTEPLTRPGRAAALGVRRVPPSEPRQPFLHHPRLRRASRISQFAVGAATEALGSDAARVAAGELRLGVVFCAFTGSVNYSRRFYEEQLRDPATASPILFTETVFNAPASHVAAYLGTTEANYTFVGDQGEFIKALALAAELLLAETVDGCLVLAAEEADWITADAMRLLSPTAAAAEGAGALYLRRTWAEVELTSITDPQLYIRGLGRADAVERMRGSLGVAESDGDLLCDGLTGTPDDSAERTAWADWSGRRVSPKRSLGDGLAAAGAWQSAFAVDALRRGCSHRAVVSVVGSNEQAVGAEIRWSDSLEERPPSRAENPERNLVRRCV